MGNTPSKGGPGQSGHGHGSSSSGTGHDSKVNRRRSLQALSGSKSSAADPSPSKESATGQYATQREHTPVQQRLQSRRIAETSSRNVERGEPTTTAAAAVGGPERRESRKGREGPAGATRMPPPTQLPEPPIIEPSGSVQVPSTAGAGERSSISRREQDMPRPALNTYYPTSSHLTRPPRLPLPIGDAMTAPGSPITVSGSAGAATAFDKANLEVEPQNSELGDIDDDELADEEGESHDPSVPKQTVPTKIEWHGHARTVFITGTFINWSRKYKLQKSESQEGLFSAEVPLRPGTHHLKFIVDGLMTTSDDLPTAVDFTNHLVNYVEVSVDDIERQPEKPPKIVIPPDIYPPKVIPESIHIEAARQAAEQQESGNNNSSNKQQEPEEEIPIGDFRNIIPQFLVDIDGEDEDSARYLQAANILGDYPTPLTLPLFLGRSILNDTTPWKDDSSVLNYPNHTVLNHLATSSIKNGVLATSVTTRYKRKYVTTILYKPT